MQAILFDLDGVIYQDDHLIDGAREVVAWAAEQRIPHLFLTNTTSRPRVAIVEKLRAMGIEAGTESVLTPPVVAAHWLKESGLQRLALFVSAATAGEFASFTTTASANDVEAVVVGDMGDGWDFATMNSAFRLLMAEPAPPLIALGMTRYWRTAHELRLDVGPFVRALEYASGCEAVVMGKPAPSFYQTALAKLAVAPEQTLMIGDDIRGDIEGAQRLGMRALLVRTGKFRPTDLAQGIYPDGVLDSIADLPRWWGG